MVRMKMMNWHVWNEVTAKDRDQSVAIEMSGELNTPQPH